MYRTLDKGVKKTQVLIICGGLLSPIGLLDLPTIARLQGVTAAARGAQLRGSTCVYLLLYWIGNKLSKKTSQKLKVFIGKHDQSRIETLGVSNFDKKELKKVARGMIPMDVEIYTKFYCLDD